CRATAQRLGDGGYRINHRGSKRRVRVSEGRRRNPRSCQGGDRAYRGPGMRPAPNRRGSTEPTARSLSDDQSRSDDLATLYPFLYAHPQDVGQASSVAGNLETVLAEVRRSTVEKVHEIVALRREVLARESQRLAACASAMAESFANGGRLFAIGNGGSCTDAADLASL